MQPCVSRLVCLLSLPAVAITASQQPQPSFLGVAEKRGDTGTSETSWDYGDGGVSWQTGSCENNVDFTQSPVNISTTVAAIPPDDDYFFFNYPQYEAPLKMVNDARFLYAKFPNDDGSIGGFAFGASYPDHLTEAYYLTKMLVHTPSEHTYGGQKMPLELQFFHRRKDATLDQDGEAGPSDTAIVAIGFQESRDEASPFLRSLIDGGLPDQRGGTTMVNRASPSVLKFSDLFKPVFGASGEQAGFWDYTGSLTQPPCSGGVRWLVRQQPLNAKAKTLKYFKDVVTKSSHGVEDNARELQIIGTRPVFPRMARNAVHMTVFDPEEPAAFKDAFANVQENQETFTSELNADAEGSDAAIADGQSKEQVLFASQEYTDCMKTLGDVAWDLSEAKARVTDECNKWEGSVTTLESITGGPAKLEAAAKVAALAKSCEDLKQVATAKDGQHQTQQEQCEVIKAEVEKKAEQAALETATEDAATAAATS